eukprot:s3600_g8.t1
MPLSQVQLAALKTPATVIAIQSEKPKKIGSKAHERFELYKSATTIHDATAKGANWQDLSTDFERGYLKIPNLMELDAEGTTSVKRGAPEGTPDKEANARSKMQNTELVPKVLVPESQDPVSRVEMSAATISALRTMMRDELKNGMTEMEERLANRLNSSVGELRAELAAEKEARQILEQRVEALEQQQTTWTKSSQDVDIEGVDKSIVVIGGFLEKTAEEIESLLGDMLQGTSGYQMFETIESTPQLLWHILIPSRMH